MPQDFFEFNRAVHRVLMVAGVSIHRRRRRRRRRYIDGTTVVVGDCCAAFEGRRKSNAAGAPPCQFARVRPAVASVVVGRSAVAAAAAAVRTPTAHVLAGRPDAISSKHYPVVGSDFRNDAPFPVFATSENRYGLSFFLFNLKK